MLKLYDLAGADPSHRFSPFCWRARMAIAHKGLDVETLPWRFTETDRLVFSGQGKVPVVVDGDSFVADSWAIANWLEDNWPDRPSLFGGAGGRAAACFVNQWADTALNPAILPLVILDVHDRLRPVDQEYFRRSREQRFGRTLEQVQAGREQRVGAFRDLLQPLRTTLARQPFVGGESLAYTDYIVFGSLQWARVCSPFELLAPDDPVAAWRERLLDAHGGLARAARCPEVEPRL